MVWLRRMTERKSEGEMEDELERYYSSIELPPNPTFYISEIPIVVLIRLATLIGEDIPTEEEGIFHGNAGIGFTLLRLADYPLFQPIRQDLLNACRRSAIPSLKMNDSTDLDPLSLMTGKAGIYAVAAVTLKLLGLDEQAREYVHLFQAQGVHSLLTPYSMNEGEGFFDGRAGYLAGALWLRKYFKKYFPARFFYQHLDLMIQTLREQAKDMFTVHPLAYSYFNMQYTGMSHGFGGTLFIILCFPSYLNERPELDEEVKLSIDFILLRQKFDGRFSTLMNEDSVIPGGDILSWRSGATGLVHLMAKAYLRWKHPRYYYSCLLVGDLIWNYGLKLIFTESIHESDIGLDQGLVGNLYVFLILYRLTNHTVYLQKAYICSIVLKEDSYYKNPTDKKNIMSLFNGLAGTLVYLLDLLNIKEAEFPFLPVFDNFEDDDINKNYIKHCILLLFYII